MKLFSAAVLALFASSPVLAASPFTVDFEKAWDYNTPGVGGYYGGGTAGDGTSGPNVGITFAGVSGLSNDTNFTYYTGAPSMLGVAFGDSTLSNTSTMTVAGGVDNVLYFSYASTADITNAVVAYDALGVQVGSLNLVASSTGDYNTWTAAAFTFNGTAVTFDLTATNGLAAFDNISSVPETSTALMMLAGGATLLSLVSRRRA